MTALDFYMFYSSNSFEVKLRGVRGSLSSPYLFFMHGIHLHSIRLTRSFMSKDGGFSAVALRAVTLRRTGCVIFLILNICGDFDDDLNLNEV
jgi:hypothetical protein